MTVRELILALLQDPMISLDQKIHVVNLSNIDSDFDLDIGESDPDPDGYRVLYIKEI